MRQKKTNTAIGYGIGMIVTENLGIPLVFRWKTVEVEDLNADVRLGQKQNHNYNYEFWFY